MYSQEGNGNGQREQEVTSPTHYIFEQFQNSYQFRILFTNPEKIFELLCPFWKGKSCSFLIRCCSPDNTTYTGIWNGFHGNVDFTKFSTCYRNAQSVYRVYPVTNYTNLTFSSFFQSWLSWQPNVGQFQNTRPSRRLWSY